MASSSNRSDLVRSLTQAIGRAINEMLEAIIICADSTLCFFVTVLIQYSIPIYVKYRLPYRKVKIKQS